MTDFGLQGQLSYALDHVNYVNAPLLPGALGDLYDSGPVLEVSMSLWSNALGRSARAQQQQARQAGLAERHGARMQSLSAQVQAESAYWRLVTARQAVGIQREALGQAQAIHDYVQKKARMKLGEASDTLQASGLVALRRLALKGAQSEEQAALKAFNTAQGRPQEEAAGELEPLPYAQLVALQVPDHRPGERADVVAAQAQAALAQAAARVDEERNKPTLEAFGTYAMSARGADADSSERALRAGDHDATTVGLRFSAPLDVVSSYKARAGARLAAQSQQEQFQQKLAQQDADWKLLVQQIRDIQESVALAGQLVDAQTAKLADARERLKDGRATTYEVLSYEQDQSQAQLQGLQLAAQLLSLRASLRLYPADGPAQAAD
jgi:outer membrane protein TolC